MERMQELTAHVFVRRNIVKFLSGVDELLDAGKMFYVFAGSISMSEELEVRHLPALLFAKYLQDAFKAPVLLLLTYDSRLKWTENHRENRFADISRNIIACGFDTSRTLITSNYRCHFVDKEVFKISRTVQLSQIVSNDSQVATIYNTVLEAALCRCRPFGEGFTLCLKLGQDLFTGAPPKPVSMEVESLPTLLGEAGQTSSHVNNFAIYLTDTRSEIARKINKHAFSGGKTSIEEHRKYGANLEIDVPFKYLRFFLDDDEEFASIEEQYGRGEMLTGVVKKRLINLLQEKLAPFTSKRLP